MTEAHTSPDGPGESSYRQLLNGLYDAVLVCDRTGRILDANGRAEEFLLTTADRLKQQSVDAFILSFDKEVLNRVRNHVAEGRQIVLDAHCVRRDQSSFPAEIAVSRIALQSPDDLVFSIRNIERRKRMLSELRTSHNAMRSSGSAILIADRDARITYANPAFVKMWGYEEGEDVLGEDVRKLWRDPGNAAQLVDSPVRGQTWEGELAAVRRNGDVFYAYATAAPNQIDDTVVGVVLSFIDITARRRAEEVIRREADAQLARARRRNDFAGRLDLLSLEDLFQLIDATAKNGVLHVQDEAGETTAQVAFETGQIAAAECDGLTGERAVHALFRRGGSTFRFEKEQALRKDLSIAHDTITILLESVRRAEEHKEDV